MGGAKFLYSRLYGFMELRVLRWRFVTVEEIWTHRGKDPRALVSIDIYSAFDNMEWNTLLEILRHHGFPEIFIKFIFLRIFSYLVA